MSERDPKPVFQWLKKATQELYLGPIREMFIDLSGLSRGQQILTVLGYISLFVLLLGLVLLESFRDLPMVTFTANEQVKQIPFLVMAICSGGFVLAWAFLLTGATDSRPLVFLPLAGFFLIQLFTTMPGSDSRTSDLWFCLAPLFFIALIVGYFMTRRKKRYWLDYPLIEFAIWFGGMAFFMTLFWFSGQSMEEKAGNLYGGLVFVGFIALVFWFVSGLAVVDASVKIARYIVSWLRRLFSQELFPTLTVFLILAHPLIDLLAIVLINPKGEKAMEAVSMAVLPDGILALVLVVVLLVLVLTRRWNIDSASLVLALGLVATVFSLGLGMLSGGQDISDPLGMALGQLGVFSPQSLFVVLMAYSLLNVVVSLANSDGKWVPRSGRFLLGFGTILLMISFAIFFANIRDASTGQLDSFQESADNFFVLGLLFLGLPYLGWIVWKKRSKLVGEEGTAAQEVRPIFAGLTSASMRKWLAIGVTVAVIIACVACMIAGLLSASATP